MKIINMQSFKEARFLAFLAMNHTDSVIDQELYWNAAIASLKEAYGK